MRYEHSALAPDDEVERQWCDTIARFADLHPLMADLRLDVSAKRAAEYLGLKNGDALGVWLDQRNLPPFRLLRDWHYVVQMVERSEHGVAVSSWSLGRGENPSVYYKFVRSVTREPWSRVQQLGSATVKRWALTLWAAHEVPKIA